MPCLTGLQREAPVSSGGRSGKGQKARGRAFPGVPTEKTRQGKGNSSGRACLRIPVVLGAQGLSLVVWYLTLAKLGEGEYQLGV